MSEDRESDSSALSEGFRQTIKQISYQNEMMLRWVNGAVITVDTEGKVLQANEVALATLGWTLEEFLGCQVHEVIHHSQDDGSEYPWEFCPVFAAIEDGSSHHVDGDVFWKKDGSSFSTDYIVCPTRKENSEINGAILTFRNITQQRLEETKRIHSRKLVAIGELSAGIAHEINTPVQFIATNISFLQECFDDLFGLIKDYHKLVDVVSGDDNLKQILKEIRDQEEAADVEYLLDEVPTAFEQTSLGIKRVAELVQGLKGFAYSGDNDQKASTDINDIIINSLAVCKNAYKYVAELQTDFGELPIIQAFPGDIGQVIVNLVVNAAHAIEGNKSEDTALGRIIISTRLADDSILITVEDTGGGIPEAVRDRIFDPFFTTKEVGKGSGQGLAISHNIINEKHGGELSFVSAAGEGTTFTVKIPIS